MALRNRFLTEGLLKNIANLHKIIMICQISLHNPSVKGIARQCLCQLAAASPVAALTAHRAVIHYRNCASLTLYTRELFRQSDRGYLTEIASVFIIRVQIPSKYKPRPS